LTGFKVLALTINERRCDNVMSGIRRIELVVVMFLEGLEVGAARGRVWASSWWGGLASRASWDVQSDFGFQYQQLICWVSILDKILVIQSSSSFQFPYCLYMVYWASCSKPLSRLAASPAEGSCITAPKTMLLRLVWRAAESDKIRCNILIAA
jgi:hypothetical protein